MAGRRPNPSHLQVVTGNPGKRPPNADEPKPQATRPARPVGMSKAAANAWPKFCDLLEGMGVLTIADGVALERLVETYAEIRALQRKIEKQGRTYETHGESGTLIKANPAVAMLADADRRLKAYLVEFGLTPAARTKVKVNPGAKQQDPAERFFG